MWQSRVERIQKLIGTVPGVTTNIMTPDDGNSYPTLSVMWDEAKFGLTIAQCAKQLSDGDPRIEVLTDSNPSEVLDRTAVIRSGTTDPIRILCRLSR